MTTLAVPVPDSMKGFLADQAAKGGYGSESEYVQALIRDAQLRSAREQLESKLDEGLRSPVSPMTDADWDELKQQVSNSTRQ